MHFDSYQAKAMTFRKPTADNVYALLGLMEEAGEVAGKFSKMRRDGKTDDFVEDVKKELGDVMWMVAAIASDLQLHLSDIAQANIDKLTKRKEAGTIGGSGDNR